MALSTAIYTILKNNSTISTAFSTRIYPGIAVREPVLPCIVYDIGNIIPDPNATSDLNWDRVDVEVTVIALEYSDAETYATNVRSALSRYIGTVDTEKINTIVFEGMSPGYDPDFTYSGSTTGMGVFTRTCNFTLIRTG